MAEFCWDCIGKYEPGTSPSLNGLRHKQRGDLVFDLCEGCGEGWFDWQGKRQDPTGESDRKDKRGGDYGGMA